MSVKTLGDLASDLEKMHAPFGYDALLQEAAGALRNADSRIGALERRVAALEGKRPGAA